MAMAAEGNNHIVEYNEIHNVIRESGDAGAYYVGRDWTQRGNILRYNYLHHIKGKGHKLKNGEGSSDTTDRVYLLSLEEAETCFAAPEDRKCVATQFALEFGAYRSSIEPTCLWWLRTPIYSENNMAALRDDDDAYMTYRIACIGTSGQIVDVGHNLICLYGVRPVIQVDTEGAEGLTFKKIKP